MAVTNVPHDTWESLENGMTLADVLRALLRRWPIVLIGGLLTVGAAYLSTRTEPVYFSRTEVIFLAPPSIRYPNELVTQTESLIVTAGAVAERINGPDAGLKYGNSTANIVGAPDTGVNTWIKLLDTGTQWVSVFDDQILVVDAKGDTPHAVTERVEAAHALIDKELRELQEEHGVSPVDYITTRMSPEQPVVWEITGSKIRAAGMTLAVGGFLTIALVVFLEVRARAERLRAADVRSWMLARITTPVRR